MTFEEYFDSVVQALQEPPHNLPAEVAQQACDDRPKSMNIFYANETVENGAALIMESLQQES